MSAEAAARPSPEDRIRAALWFAEHGFGVFTVWSTTPDGVCRCPKKAACENAGKHPIGHQGFIDNTRDPDRIRTLLSAGSEPNYGLVCPEGVFVLDVDGEGVARLAELEAKHGPLPPTLRTNTANGQHLFLRWPEALPRPIGNMFDYVTRWGSGSNAGYVVGPRSVHASGAVYAPASAFVDIAELPEAWAHAVIAPTDWVDEITVHGGYVLPPAGYGGSRYEAIRDYIASRYMRGVTRDEILAGVLTVLAPRFAEPLPEADVRSRFDRAWKGTAERLGPPMGEPEPKRPRIVGGGIDAVDLLALNLPALRFVVPDLIPEGTTILAAAPKVGKSCLVYQVAVEASIGGDLFGRRVTPGSVLYLALEDGQRRGQDRLRNALAGRTMPRGRLEVQWNANRIGEGLEDDLAGWLDGHSDAVMVAIDTLGKVRPHSDGRRNAYEVDVQHMARLQDLFRDRTVALVIVHHARKESSDDFLTSVSGTYGVTGSADTIIMLRRKRLEAFGSIVATGRDIPDIDLSVEFVDGLWREAPGALSAASFDRTEVYRVIESAGPIYPQAIAEKIGKSRSNVANMVERLANSGAVMRTGHGWVVAAVGLADDEPRARARINVPRDCSDSGESLASLESPGTRAREAVWLRPCRDYPNHQDHHRHTPAGWVCAACDKEDGL